MVTNDKRTCSVCGQDATLETTDLPEEWPRKLTYICPNGHRMVVVECSDPKLMRPATPTNPNLPTKDIYKLEARPEQEIELYEVAATVRRKIGKSNPKAHTLLNELDVRRQPMSA